MKTSGKKVLIENSVLLQGKEHSGPFWGKSAPKWVKTSKLAKKNFKFEIYDLKNVSMKCVTRTEQFLQTKGHGSPCLDESASEWVKTSKLAQNNLKIEI